jgi:hypothetical protein
MTGVTEMGEIKFMGRIGKLGGQVSCRPYRVVIGEGEIRREILKGSSKLKQVSGLENIYVSPDLTKVQQAEDKNLRKKLKEIREAGEREAKIAQGKIVKWTDNQVQVLYEPSV